MKKKPETVTLPQSRVAGGGLMDAGSGFRLPEISFCSDLLINNSRHGDHVHECDFASGELESIRERVRARSQ